MTIKEAILSFPGLSDISDHYVEKILIDRAVDGTIDYSIDHKQNVDLCAADCYVYIVNDPDFSEGKYSQKMSRGSMMEAAAKLYRANGESEKADDLEITGASKSNWW